MYNRKSSLRTASRSWTYIAVWARALCPSFRLSHHCYHRTHRFKHERISNIDKEILMARSNTIVVEWLNDLDRVVSPRQHWKYECCIKSESINQSINQSVKQSFTQAVQQSINQTINWMWRFLLSLCPTLAKKRVLQGAAHAGYSFCEHACTPVTYMHLMSPAHVVSMHSNDL